MTVLATFEIGTGGSPSPGQGKGLGAAQGAALDGAVWQSFLPAIAPGTESFRAGWQSLLASMTSHGEDFSEREAGADRGSPSAGSAQNEAAGNKFAANLSVGSVLRSGQGTQEQGRQAGAVQLPPADAGAEARVAKTASGAAQQATARRDSTITAGRKTATEPQTAVAARSAHSIHFTKPGAVPGEATSGLVPGANAGIVQNVPVPEIVVARTDSADVKEQSPLPGPVIDLRAAADSATFDAHASLPERPVVAGEAKTVPRESTVEGATPSQQMPDLPLSGPSGASGLVINATERSQTQEDAPTQAAKAVQSEDELDRPAAGGNLTQTLPDRQSPAQAAAPEPVQAPAVSPSHGSIEKPTDLQNQDRALPGSQNVAPSLASRPISAGAVAPSQTPMPTEARSENSIQRFAQDQSQVPMQRVKQGGGAWPALTGNEPLDALPVAVHVASSSNQFVAPAQTVNKPGSAVSGKSLTPSILRPARGSGKLGAVGPGDRAPEGQPLGPSVNGPAMAGDLAGAHGAMSKAGGPAGGSALTATGPDSREPFATLDVAAATGRPTLIHAAPQRAEAGFQDPVLGWVGVRADASGGGVHAEVVPGSADAAQALGSHLAGLNAYLAEHHTQVETLTMSAPEGEGAGLGSGQSAGQGAGHQTGQESAQGADGGLPSGPAMRSEARPAVAAEHSGLFGGLDRSRQAGEAGGVHISVMA